MGSWGGEIFWGGEVFWLGGRVGVGVGIGIRHFGIGKKRRGWGLMLFVGRVVEGVVGGGEAVVDDKRLTWGGGGFFVKYYSMNKGKVVSNMKKRVGNAPRCPWI